MQSKVVGMADAEQDGAGRGSEGRGQGNFELATNCDYILLGQLTQGKVSVSVGFQSFPLPPTMWPFAFPCPFRLALLDVG